MVNDTSTLLRHDVFLEYITLGWNVVGTVIVIAAALAARAVYDRLERRANVYTDRTSTQFP